MNAIERKDWHKREHDILIEKDSLDWKRAEKYKEQHSPYNKDNIIIKEVWRDKDNYLCVQYASSPRKMLNWFHYTVNNGELEWW